MRYSISLDRRAYRITEAKRSIIERSWSNRIRVFKAKSQKFYLQQYHAVIYKLYVFNMLNSRVVGYETSNTLTEVHQGYFDAASYSQSVLNCLLELVHNP